MSKKKQKLDLTPEQAKEFAEMLKDKMDISYYELKNLILKQNNLPFMNSLLTGRLHVEFFIESRLAAYVNSDCEEKSKVVEVEDFLKDCRSSFEAWAAHDHNVPKKPLSDEEPQKPN
jgi:hypothetical protein